MNENTTFKELERELKNHRQYLDRLLLAAFGLSTEELLRGQKGANNAEGSDYSGAESRSETKR